MSAALSGVLGWALFHSSTGAASDFNLQYPHVPNQLIVKFKKSVQKDSKANLLNAMGAQSLHTFTSAGAQVIQLSAKADDGALAAYAAALAEDPRVEYVEANTIIKADAVPNDTRFGDLWGMRNSGLNNGLAGADIKAVEAWDLATGSKQVVVGIIDTGIDYTHPDIAPNIWNNPGEVGLDAQGRDKTTNGVDDDGNGFVDDFRGWNFVANTNDPKDDNKHGTHCAGTIGGRGNDGVGVAGVNWNVSMVAMKFLDGAGSGSLENAVKAIEYGTKLGVKLTSNSWGGGGFSQTMMDAIKAAGDKGILFVAAAGNDAANNDTDPHYPSSYQLANIISVAASDNRDELASFSNRGVRTVHLAAPGKDILSSVPNGGYELLSGTSMATPHVSGAVALVKAHFPALTMLQVKERILGTVDGTNAAAATTITGGRLNILNALEVDTTAPGTIVNPVVGLETMTSFQLSFDPAGDDGNTGLAKRYQVRTSSNPIVSLADWTAAKDVSFAVVSQTALRVVLEIGGLTFNATGYVAVRAVDNVGNIGGVSSDMPYATMRVRMIESNPAESLSGLDVSGWGLETLADGSHAFSDSVAGQYAASANTSLATAAIAVPSADATLAFSIKHDVESGYDYCRVEISTNAGTTWQELKKYTGVSDWKVEALPLTTALGAARTFKIRFKLTSDSSIQGDGCLIDNLQVFGPEN